MLVWHVKGNKKHCLATNEPTPTQDLASITSYNRKRKEGFFSPFFAVVFLVYCLFLHSSIAIAKYTPAIEFLRWQLELQYFLVYFSSFKFGVVDQWGFQSTAGTWTGYLLSSATPTLCILGRNLLRYYFLLELFVEVENGKLVQANILQHSIIIYYHRYIKTSILILLLLFFARLWLAQLVVLHFMLSVRLISSETALKKGQLHWSYIYPCWYLKVVISLDWEMLLET